MMLLVPLEFLVFNFRSRYGPAEPVCHNELQEDKLKKQKQNK